MDFFYMFWNKNVTPDLDILIFLDVATFDSQNASLCIKVNGLDTDSQSCPHFVYTHAPSGWFVLDFPGINVKYKRTDATIEQTIEYQWTFMDPWKPEVGPRVWKESAFPSWVATSNIIDCMPQLNFNDYPQVTSLTAYHN